MFLRSLKTNLWMLSEVHYHKPSNDKIISILEITVQSYKLNNNKYMIALTQSFEPYSFVYNKKRQ